MCIRDRYIVVDLGTSAVKLLLMDESGKVLNIVSKEYPCLLYTSKMAEHNLNAELAFVLEKDKQEIKDITYS